MSVLRAILLTWLVATMPAAAQDAVPAAPPAETEIPRDRVHPAWTDFEPQFHPHICPIGSHLDYDPEEFRCGYVMVPEDRTDPGSRLIRLSVLNIRSTSDTPPLGAIVRLTGGPGGPSLGAGRINAYQRNTNAPVRAAADLIFFDQRGVGYSQGQFCRAIAQPYQTGLETGTAGRKAYRAALRRCLREARAGAIAVDGYTNWQNALDVRDLRRALGYEQWNLFGVSYGTELAQAVMQVDADGVRAAILDSVVPTGLPLDPLQGAGFRSALDAVQGMCDADPDCAREMPDMTARFIAVFETYDSDPLRLTGVSHRRAQNGALLIDGDLAAGAVFQALYRSGVYGSLPAMLHVLETRDTEALRAYVDVLGYAIDHAYGHGMSLTINCAGGGSGAMPPELAEKAGSAPQLQDWMDTVQFWAGCESLVGDMPDPTDRPLVSDIPTLVLTGEADPITPPWFADPVMAGLANGQRVDFVHTGHGALVSNWETCGRDMMLGFLTDPLAPVDAACAGAIAAPDFLVDLRETKAPYRLARELQAGRWPWMPLIAAGGLMVILAAFPLAALARRIDGEPSADYGRARLFAWTGGGLSLIGIVLVGRSLVITAESHPASLVVGVPAHIATAGWLALAGFALCLIALMQLARHLARPGQRLGTRLAILLAALFSGAVLWFLFTIDAGPFVI